MSSVKSVSSKLDASEEEKKETVSWSWYDESTKSWKNARGSQAIEQLERDYAKYIKSGTYPQHVYHCFGNGFSAVINFRKMKTECGSERCMLKHGTKDGLEEDHMTFQVQRTVQLTEKKEKAKDEQDVFPIQKESRTWEQLVDLAEGGALDDSHGRKQDALIQILFILRQVKTLSSLNKKINENNQEEAFVIEPPPGYREYEK